MSTATHPTATLRESTPANVPLPRTGSDYFTTLLRRLRAPHNGSGVPQIIGILGCERGVGVSTIAANLAIEAAAASDAKVLLIDANLHHATLGPAFRVAVGPGWTEMLSGAETADQCVQATQIERLSLLSAGRETASAHDTKNTTGAAHLAESLHTLRQQYGLVIVDLPAADELHSALENSGLDLLRKLDGIVLVIEAEKTRGEAAQRIKQHLLDAGAHVLARYLTNDARNSPAAVLADMAREASVDHVRFSACSETAMLLTWLKKSLQRQRTSIPADFHSPDVLRAIIERERLRHDRTGGSFALLTVKLVNDASRPGDLADLCEVLQRRLRATDDVGLLKPDCAGVLLPDTEEVGARKVVQDLEAELTGRGVAVEMEMLIYPAEPESNADGDSSDSKSNGSNSNSSDSRDSGSDESEAKESNGQAKALAELLAQPLPPWKRLIDVATASTALLLLSPLLLLTALVVKLTSRGPVFYVQRRTGLGARPFSMYKFRTMVVEADQLKEQLMELNEQDGPAFKIERDPRVTWIGRVLRCTSIDELPQLWNVLCGQMSLVGPRPLPVNESAACRLWQLRRLDVTPGLTCIWQVKDRRNKIAFNEWMRMDLAYVESRTLGHDLKLMLLTIRTLLLAWRA